MAAGRTAIMAGLLNTRIFGHADADQASIDEGNVLFWSTLEASPQPREPVAAWDAWSVRHHHAKSANGHARLPAQANRPGLVADAWLAFLRAQRFDALDDGLTIEWPLFLPTTNSCGSDSAC